MILDDRERTPPPPGCMDCQHRVTYRGVSSHGDRVEIRNHCIHPMTGGLMHPECAWHTPRRDGVATQEHDI